MIEKAKRSVVDVQTDGRFKLRGYDAPYFHEVFLADFFERELVAQTKFEYKSEGTGVVIDAAGLILTNAHVVSLFDAIQVRTHDGKILPAELLAKDIDQDLALLQVKDAYAFEPMPMADPAQIKVSEPVYAIGNPYAYSQTVTQGIVSALHRRVELDPKHPFEDMVQTTADVNPGNSGGPLINQAGQMIGIMTLGDPRARGINFAISIETIQKLLPQLKTPVTLTEDWQAFVGRYGFLVEENTDETGMTYLVISDVQVDSQAFKAGLRPKDILHGFHQSRPKEISALLKEFKTLKPAAIVYVQIERNQRNLFTYVSAK